VDDVVADRLMAIDGASGSAVSKGATTLYNELIARQTTCGVSRWDASGLFSDVVSAPADQRDVSPRTLLLLYAADLAFRLRWEIAPALESGLIVIAAPYVTTPIAFGLATGLSSDWLRTLFRFAPIPGRTAVLREPKSARSWKRRPDRGFGECCTTLLEATPEGFARKKTRTAMVGALSTAAEKHGGLFRKRDLRAAAEDLVSAAARKPRKKKA
jgi:thymidylate kinase